MRAKTYLFFTGVIFLVGTIKAKSQTPSSDAATVRMLRECYTAFNYTWATKKGPALQKKLDSIQQKYCTPRLVDKFRALGSEFDILAYNEYTDVKHLNTIAVTKDGAQDNAYFVSYIEHTTRDSKPVDLKITIHVIVDPDELKISSVK